MLVGRKNFLIFNYGPKTSNKPCFWPFLAQKWVIFSKFSALRAEAGGGWAQLYFSGPPGGGLDPGWTHPPSPEAGWLAGPPPGGGGPPTLRNALLRHTLAVLMVVEIGRQKKEGETEMLSPWV